MKRALAAFLIFALLPIMAFAENEQGSMRALIIACDSFVSQDSIAPSASGNVEALRSILSCDKRTFEQINSKTNIAYDKRTLAREIKINFSKASNNDVNIIYISTHGEIGKDGKLNIIFSDGATESVVTGMSCLTS